MTRLILYNTEYLMGCRGTILEYLCFWRRISNQEEIKNRICKSLKEYNPDILALIEIEKKSFLNNHHFINEIKKELGLKYSIQRIKYHFTGFSKILKHFPLIKNQSNSILSKKRIIDHRFFYFKNGFKKAVIKAVVNCPKRVSIFLVHLSLGGSTREKQLKELTALIKKTKEPVIIAGDLNTFTGEKEIKKFLQQTKLRNKLSAKRKRTFPTCHPIKTFDYILASPKIKIRNCQILKIPFSDHLPI
jgi:endonuclease/exonuclease/phosphatase family metal-dependent hydrolase